MEQVDLLDLDHDEEELRILLKNKFKVITDTMTRRSSEYSSRIS